MARYKMMVLMAVTAAMVAGCAGSVVPQYLNYDGHKITTTKLSAPEDIKARMAQDGAVSMEAFGANTAALRVEASRVETIRLDPENSEFIASKKRMGWDPHRMTGLHRKIYLDYLNQKNAASATLTFSKPLEVYSYRNGMYGFFTNYLGTEAFRKEFKEKTAMCQWAINVAPIQKPGNGAYYYVDAQNSSTTLSEFMLQLKYSDKAKALPETDPCSVKEAEKLLRQYVDLIIGRQK